MSERLQKLLSISNITPEMPIKEYLEHGNPKRIYINLGVETAIETLRRNIGNSKTTFILLRALAHMISLTEIR